MTKDPTVADWNEPVRSTPPHRPHWATMFMLWVVVFLLVWGLVRSPGPSPIHNPTAQAREITPRDDLLPEEQRTIDVFRASSPSVVHITTSELARNMFSLDVFSIPRGTGSGILYNKDGYVVTNYHVIEPGRTWTVRLADQSEWEAKLVGVAIDKDLAVLKIDAPSKHLTPIALGTSSDVQVGQFVLAIGNPFGLDQTLTTGVVSALGRQIPSPSRSGRPIEDVIQTDAAINPGNSGGPLLDSAGRLIGINTQIASPSGASAGIGFAIPVDTVHRIVPDLIRYGKVRQPGLGVSIVRDSLARRIGVRTGVLLNRVYKDSAAESAGLRGTTVTRDGRIAQLGDVITAINDAPTATTFDVLSALERFEIGTEVTVTYVREGTAHEAVVRLQSVESR